MEHLGRCVYTGVFEPGHPTADADGVRGDVLALVRELGVTAVRYPGGNFVSGYRWEDSVGPVEERPRRLDLAWRSTETNRFGLSEFISFLRKIGPQAEPMMALNLGTRGVAEALQLQEYANHPGGTALSDLRAEHGDKDPFGIRLWCLGNEMDGPWQTGHKTAEEYGPSRRRDRPRHAPDRPRRAARRLRLLGPLHAHLRRVGGHRPPGDVRPRRPHLPARLLRAARRRRGLLPRLRRRHGDLHRGRGGHLRPRRGAPEVPKKINLSFDEWNVWYMSRTEEQVSALDWPEAPRLLEDSYSVMDAVVLGSLLIALLRHADRVTVACLAQLVNVIAPIMTEPGGPAWRQTTFYPFAQASKYGRGEVLDVRVDSPTYGTRKYGEADLLHATAVRAEDGTVTVFAVNRSRTEPLPLEVALNGLGPTSVVEHSVLADADPDARNTLAEPDRVTPHMAEGTALDGGLLTAVLEPLSWNVIRLA